MEWQLQAVARTLGLAGLFVSQAAQQTGVQVPEVLAEGAEWIRACGYELLFVETGADDYLALPVRPDLLAQAQATAHKLELETHRL